MSKKILIIHPEGNIHNNPNLLGIVQILCENGYNVDVISLKRPEIYQGPPCPNAQLITHDRKLDLPDYFGYVSLHSLESINAEEIIRYYSTQFTRYQIIIGVDRGIIEASIISKIQGIPLGYISYEIFFEDETGSEFKKAEINACSAIQFAICQDDLRSYHLSIQNKIARDLIVNIPVTGRVKESIAQDNFLRDSLNIPKNKKIAIYIGSIALWGGLNFLLNLEKDMPDDWVLVLHSRYSNESDFLKLQQIVKSDKLFFSTDAIDSVSDMEKILSSVDLGISLYTPDYNSIFSGKNLEYIGLASGKSFTYLQNNIPIFINEVGELSQIVRQEKIGFSHDLTTPLQFPSDKQLTEFKQNIRSILLTKFNLDSLFLPVLNRINQLVNLPLHHQTSKPSISILLPSKGRENLLFVTLNSIEIAKGSCKVEVLLLLNGTREQGEKIEKAFPFVTVFLENDHFSERPSWGKLMNFLLHKSSGETVMYGSDDCLFHEKSLEVAYQKIKENPDIVAGAAMAYRNAIADDKLWNQFGFDYTIGNNLFINYGLLARERVLQAGGFSEEYSFYCADGDICLTLIKEGFQIVPCPEAQVVHLNFLDEVKESNLSVANSDISIYRNKWYSVFGSIEPSPRRKLLSASTP